MASVGVAARRPRLRASNAALVGAGLLCVGLLSAEALRRAAQDDSLMAHQARRDCLAMESHAVAGCRVLAARHPEDADYCGPAVQACRRNGTDAAIDVAEARLDRWWSAAIALRRAVALAVLAGAAWCAGSLVRRAVRRLRKA